MIFRGRGRSYVKSRSAELELVGGHLAAEVDGVRVLLDTGSPVSFGRYGAIDVLGDPFDLPWAGGHETIESVERELVGLLSASATRGVDAVLGTDVLWDHVLALDFEQGILELSGPGRPLRALPERTITRAPTTVLTMSGPLAAGGRRDLLALLHTGSRLSFLGPGVLEGRPVAATGMDFMCGVGRLEASLHGARVSLLGRTVEALFGEPPPPLKRLMEDLGVEVVVGTELMAGLGRVSLALRDGDDALMDGRPPRRAPARDRTGYPHVVVRLMPAVYASRGVRFSASRPRETGTAFVVECAEPLGPDGFTLPARQALIHRVLQECRSTGFSMCCVFGDSDAVYCWPHGATSPDTARPSGGLTVVQGHGMVPARR